MNVRTIPLCCPIPDILILPTNGKAVEDFYLTFDRFMDKDFFNQRIQKFSRQFCGIDILFHQTYPLFSVNRCLGSGLHRFVKPFNFAFNSRCSP